jgi:two-component system sensor histidine kinase MtrB
VATRVSSGGATAEVRRDPPRAAVAGPLRAPECMELAWGRMAARQDESEARAAPEPRSVRALALSAAIGIGLLVLGAGGSLLWSGLDTRRTTDEWLRATQGQALVDAALVHLLVYRRLSDYAFVTGDRQAARAARARAARLDRALLEASELTTDPRERAMLDLARRQAAEYRARQHALESETRDIGAVVTQADPDVGRVVESLEVLRDLHQEDIDAAYARIRRSVVLSDVIGVGLAIVFLLALLALMGVVVVSTVRPVLALHAAIEGFRSGDLGSRAPEKGAREVRAVARAYNAMADTLAAQRSGQLTYLAGVAHDLRNPLATMKMGLPLIVRDHSPAASRRTIELLDRQIDRMTRMVDDLLNATRIEAGELRMSAEIFDLCDHAREAIEVHAPTFPSHQLVLEESSAPVMVSADPGRIDQVLNNLLTNALKFSPVGSRVDLRVCARGPDAVVEVEDQGIGMTRDQQRDLFAPFRRHAPAVAPGAGLGLSITRRIVEAHRGRIEVESEPGRGSRFRVILPLASEEEPANGRRADRG